MDRTGETVFWGGYLARALGVVKAHQHTTENNISLSWGSSTTGWKEGVFPKKLVDRLEARNGEARNGEARNGEARNGEARNGEQVHQGAHREAKKRYSDADLLKHNTTAYALLDGVSKPTSDSPFGPLVRHLYVLKELEKKMARQAKAPEQLTEAFITERLEESHELWYSYTTFRNPSNGETVDAIVSDEVGEFEKEPDDSPFASNSHFGFSRMSTTLSLPKNAEFPIFRDNIARVVTIVVMTSNHSSNVEKAQTEMTYKEFARRKNELYGIGSKGTYGSKGTGNGSFDEIDAFLDSKLYSESYERANFAANIGTLVHQQLLLRAITEDAMDSMNGRNGRSATQQLPWVYKDGYYRAISQIGQGSPKKRLVQHVFPDNKVPKDIFESIVPVREKRSPLDEAVSRLHNTLWTVQKRALPGMVIMAAEYEVICPFGIFNTGGLKAKGSKGPKGQLGGTSDFKGWRFLKTRIDAVGFDGRELSIIDYKSRVGSTTQSEIGDPNHVLQAVLNAYLFACVTRIVPDSCVLVYGNRTPSGAPSASSNRIPSASNSKFVAGHTFSFPFKRDLIPGTFVFRALSVLFSSLPALFSFGPYVLDSSLSNSWDLFDVSILERLPRVKDMIHFNNNKTARSVYIAGVLGPNMCIDQVEKVGYGPIDEFRLRKVAGCRKVEPVVYLWDTDTAVSETKKGRAEPAGDHGATRPVVEKPLLPDYPRDAKRPVKPKAPKASTAVPKMAKEQAKAGAKGKGVSSLTSLTSSTSTSLTSSSSSESSFEIPAVANYGHAQHGHGSGHAQRGHGSGHTKDGHVQHVHGSGGRRPDGGHVQHGHVQHGHVQHGHGSGYAQHGHGSGGHAQHGSGSGGRRPDGGQLPETSVQRPDRSDRGHNGGRVERGREKHVGATLHGPRRETRATTRNVQPFVPSTVGVVGADDNSKQSTALRRHEDFLEQREKEARAANERKRQREKELEQGAMSAIRAIEGNLGTNYGANPGTNVGTTLGAKAPENVPEKASNERNIAQARLHKAVQEAGETMLFHPIVANRSSRWLRQALEKVAGEPGPEDISARYQVARAVPEQKKKLEACIRALNRLLNKRILAVITSSLRDTKGAGNGNQPSKPKPQIFPHLSQRSYWTTELLDLGTKLVPTVVREISLGIEKASKE
jgi:hypothetical protein